MTAFLDRLEVFYLAAREGYAAVDIKQLKYFIAIAETGSFSAASLKLGVAQPSLSQHVIKIEQELGVTLVHRSPRGIVVTQSGEILLRHAREICANMVACREAVRQSGSVAQGLVAFGLPPSVSMVLSVPLAETVRLTLPQVRLQAIEAMSGFIKIWLDDHTVDLGFLYDIEDVRNFDVRQLMSEDLHFFAAPDDWPLSRPPGTPVPLAEIRHLELILPSQRHGLRRTIDRFVRSAGVELDISIEMDALSQIKELVMRGSGYTILAPAAAHDRVERGELVSSPIVDPPMTRPVYLVRNLAKPLTQACREVERITLEVVDDLVRRGIWQASGTRARTIPAGRP
jgi:LysR family transcriptional regulator, nitrogen assimilation regulatory protein